MDNPMGYIVLIPLAILAAGFAYATLAPDRKLPSNHSKH